MLCDLLSVTGVFSPHSSQASIFSSNFKLFLLLITTCFDACFSFFSGTPGSMLDRAIDIEEEEYHDFLRLVNKYNSSVLDFVFLLLINQSINHITSPLGPC